jgi:hypothetical protein
MEPMAQCTMTVMLGAIVVLAVMVEASVVYDRSRQNCSRIL